MNNTTRKRSAAKRSTRGLALVALLGLSVFSSAAQACLYYKNTSARTNLWGLPEENTSSVQAVVPAGSRVCVDEQLPGANGETWARVSFYVTNEIRFSARGWVNVERFAKTAAAERPAPAKTTPAVQSPDTTSKTDPIKKPVSGANRDDDAMIDTLAAQRRELDQLKKQNAALEKRLGALPKTKEKMTDWKKGGKLKNARTEKAPVLPPADPAFLQQGWRLVPSQSRLHVESVTDGSLVENHRFTKLSGNISRDGKASIKVALDNIDTGVKMRNIRLSHLLFQSDKYPVATISATLDKKSLGPLKDKGRQLFDLKIGLDLHGRQKEFTTKVKLTRMSDGRLRVASLAPVMISTADFALGKGLKKLITIAGGKDIIPVIPVRFNFVFTNDG